MPDREYATKQDLSEFAQKTAGDFRANKEEFKEEIVRHFGVVAEGLEDKIQIMAEGHQMLVRHFGVVAEGLEDKIQIMAEGHQMLAEKMEQMEQRLGAKIDRLGQELTEHRHNTEVHNLNLKKGKG
jgi:uncharacterized membrane-anchored protein YhcB (DUF1043 family)